MKSIMTSIILVLNVTSVAYGQASQVVQDTQARPAVKSVKISIQGFPLYLDTLQPRPVGSKVAYYAEGTARIEDSQIMINLAPGFAFPKGGLVIDDKTRISPELMSALGLSSTAQLVSGRYPWPPPFLPNKGDSLRTGGPKVGVEIGIKFTWGK